MKQNRVPNGTALESRCSSTARVKLLGYNTLSGWLGDQPNTLRDEPGGFYTGLDDQHMTRLERGSLR